MTTVAPPNFRYFERWIGISGFAISITDFTRWESENQDSLLGLWIAALRIEAVEVALLWFVNDDGGTGFYRFLVSDPVEAERCQTGPRRLR
jgi:hypothetical protein